MNNRDFNILMICAFRYALTRHTYIVSDIADLIRKYEKEINGRNRYYIVKEIEVALETEHLMEMDADIWRQLLIDLEGETNE